MLETLRTRLPVFLAVAIASTATLRVAAEEETAAKAAVSTPHKTTPAGVPTEPSEAPARRKRDTYPFRGVIGSIDTTARTLTLEGRQNRRILQLTDATRVEKHGQSSRVEDLKPGETVGGTLRRASAGGHEEALLIRVGPKAESNAGSASRKSPGPGEGGAAP